MTLQKRAFDLILALALALLLWPLFLLVAFAILVLDGRPVFYVSERMRTSDKAFRLIKFRTMRPSEVNAGVSGGDKADRITRTGAFLRNTRLDELPQLWNVLRGDISFVGPRPPLRSYVEAFPELYRQVLQSRPGITGLATVAFHRTEERLLAMCHTAEETDAVYRQRCVPRKATLDLIYQRNVSVCFDLRIMLATVWRRIKLH